MKTRLLITAFLLLFCITVSTAAEVKGRVLNYGVFKRSEKEEVVKTPETTSGITRIPSGIPILTTATNRIPAKTGICFGMWYEVTNLKAKDGDSVDIVKVVRHPMMTKPDGTTSKGFTFVEKQIAKDGRVLSWTGYGFDHPYELAPGVWEIAMKHDGKTLFTQEFIVAPK